MTDGRPPLVAHYDPPFAEADFYYLPAGWLRSVRLTGELDALDLLFFLLDDDYGEAYFRSETDRGRLTREPAAGDAPASETEPSDLTVLSHTTFEAQVNALTDAGKLVSLPGRPTGYRILGWPAFDGGPTLYRPRLYIEQRWPHWFGKNRWAPRIALLALLARLREEHARPGAGRGPAASAALCDTTIVASRNELRKLAEQTLDDPAVRSQIGPGLEWLAALGVARRVTAGDNPRFAFRVAALAQPPEWAKESVAAVCGLDPVADAALVALVTTCLRATRRPVAEAPEMWRSLRKNPRALATPDDIAGFEAFVARAAPRTVESIRGLLKDYVKSSDAAQRGALSNGFDLPVGEAALADGVLMPQEPLLRVQAAQLVIHCQRRRLSIVNTIAALRRVTLFALQDGTHVVITAGIHADEYGVKAGPIVVGCNHLITALRLDRPFTVGLRCDAPPAGVTLGCQFRLLGASLAGRVTQRRA